MKVVYVMLAALVLWPGLGSAQVDPAPRPTPDLPVRPFNYSLPDLPPFYFQTDIVRSDNTPGDNPTTDQGATLGRVLFYDTALSRNRAVSASSGTSAPRASRPRC
ncbi:MAG TPA: hypothetical protein VGL15_09770 [Vicinamibacteria bacterium]|jgi:hypothetical protein